MCAAPSEPRPPYETRARRTPVRSPGPEGRAYPDESGYHDHEAVQARLNATRALLGATSPEQVVAIVATLVRDLGGGLLPANLGERSAFPLDVSLGLGAPTLPWAEPVSVAGMRLSAVLPHFVEDARAVLHRLQAAQRRADEAEVDPLTGLLTRRAWMRQLGQATEAASVALLDLDHFKAVNDTDGHAAGDEVLRALGACLRDHFRDGDACGRYGGDELACLSPGMPAQALASRMDAVRLAWRRSRPSSASAVGLSAGVAAVGPLGPRAALEAADRALYRAKAAGRDRTELSIELPEQDKHRGPAR